MQLLNIKHELQHDVLLELTQVQLNVWLIVIIVKMADRCHTD